MDYENELLRGPVNRLLKISHATGDKLAVASLVSSWCALRLTTIPVSIGAGIVAGTAQSIITTTSELEVLRTGKDRFLMNWTECKSALGMAWDVGFATATFLCDEIDNSHIEGLHILRQAKQQRLAGHRP